MSYQDQHMSGTDASRAEAVRWLQQNRLASDETALGKATGRGWMWATTLAGAIGLAIGWIVYMTIDRGTGDHSIILLFYRLVDLTSLTGYMSGGLVVGAVVGAIQGSRLKRYFPTFAGGWWVLATSLAGALSGLIVWVPTSGFVFDLHPILDFAPFSGAIISHTAIGVLFGVAQWLVLRGYVPGAGRWIAACVGGSVGGAFLIMLVLVTPLSYSILAYYFCLNIPFNALIGAAGFLPAGAATSYLLSGMLYKEHAKTGSLSERA